MLKELDCVALVDDLPDHRLRRGDVGTIVDVLGGGEAYFVDFLDLTGDTVAVLVLRAAQVRPVESGEIPNARPIDPATSPVEVSR